MKKNCNECGKKFVISQPAYQERKNKLVDHGEMNLCVKHYLEARETVHEQAYFQNMG